MALRRQAAGEQLVPLAEVLAHVAGDGSAPDSWGLQAEQVADTMRAAVTRDWRQRPCVN